MTWKLQLPNSYSKPTMGAVFKKLPPLSKKAIRGLAPGIADLEKCPLQSIL
jgi:hypothetical protein